MANAVGGVCAEAGNEEDVSATNASSAAAGILMRRVRSNRSAKGVFAENCENAREEGKGQREEAEDTPTEMFIRG